MKLKLVIAATLLLTACDYVKVYPDVTKKMLEVGEVACAPYSGLRYITLKESNDMLSIPAHSIYCTCIDNTRVSVLVANL